MVLKFPETEVPPPMGSENKPNLLVVVVSVSMYSEVPEGEPS
jgi:hypothetical protein